MREDIAGAQGASSRPMWETLEGMVREKAQEFIQQIMEEEVTELLSREKSERRSTVDSAEGYRNGYGKPRRPIGAQTCSSAGVGSWTTGRPTSPAEAGSYKGLYRSFVRLEACRASDGSLQGGRHASESAHSKPVLQSSCCLRWHNTEFA